jgi:hypothetical protein
VTTLGSPALGSGAGTFIMAVVLCGARQLLVLTTDGTCCTVRPPRRAWPATMMTNKYLLLHTNYLLLVQMLFRHPLREAAASALPLPSKATTSSK